ncbi:NAD(P)-dependent oxidoreductase [Pseudomonadota bacterium]
MKIGLIGLGNMGTHFARRWLDAGYDLSVNDANTILVREFVARGAHASTSAKAMATEVDAVFLSLPTPDVVSTVATGTDGLIEGSKIEVVVDLSTTGPTVSRFVAAKLAEEDISFIGAPVSGGTLAAEKGSLAIMASGSAEYLKKLESVFSIIGNHHFYLGEDPGNGQTMKIINNTLCAVNNVAAMEALVYGAKSGLDSETMLNVLNVSSGRSFATLEKIPQCILDRSFPMRFTTELIHKDVGLCLEEAEKAGATMPMGTAAEQLLAFVISQGDGRKDYAHVIKHFEKLSGAVFGSPSDS